VTIKADCRVTEDHRNRTGKSHAHLFIGAAFLLADFSLSVTVARAQSSVPLPAVTVESPARPRTTLPVRGLVGGGRA
jgi:iron complex outermembrane receptor protein